MLKILITPHPLLVKRSLSVRKFDKKLAKIISDMEKTLSQTHDPVGVGLAAPQVEISSRFFLAKPRQNGKTMVFINPEIVSKILAQEKTRHSARKKSKRLLEGCLSIPNIWGKVIRPKEITLKYQDALGKKHTKKISGFLSAIVQHEIDHLNGVLFTQHVLAQNGNLYRSYKNEEGEDEFEEIEI